ncbi:MAG: LCP family protein [Candidatus Moraniibacteriota bacterium]
MDSLRKSPPETPVLPAGPRTAYLPAVSFVPETYMPAARTPRRALPWKKILLIAIIALFLTVLGAVTFFLYKSLAVSRSIQIRNDAPASFFADMRRLTSSFIGAENPLLRGEEAGRINILLLGRAGERYPGRNLTDTVMMMSIDTIGKKVALLSLPRDLYAPIPDTPLYTKINSLYQYGLGQGDGVAPLSASVEEITGQTIDYFFILDFDGFEKAIDALGGIQVEVLRDFYDPRYPGKNYSYETFEIKKGWQTLDGATALKYVRERHNDPEGDFGRAKRQQQVIQAVKDKAFSLGTFFNIFAVNGILDALGESIRTDMSLDDMEGLLRLTRTLDTKNIATVVVDAWKRESLLRVSHIPVGPTTAFILVPRVGNWSEIHDISKNIFHLDELRARHTRITEEQSTLAILYAPGDFAIAEKMKWLAIGEMGIAEVSLAPLRSLENRPEQSMIADRSALGKPFSLDGLLKRFALKKTDAPFPVLPAGDISDFVIIIGADLAAALSFDEGTADMIPDDDAFPEIFPPQPRLEKNEE